MQETQEIQARSLGQEDPFEEEMANHSSILAWIIPWTEELAGYSPWGHKESDTTERLTLLAHVTVLMNTYPVSAKQRAGHYGYKGELEMTIISREFQELEILSPQLSDF